MKEKLKKLAELLKADENLAKELFTMTDPEAVQKWMASHGIDMTLDEVMAIEARLASTSKDDIELSDAELEKVAGGYSFEEFLEDLKDIIMNGDAG